MSETKSLTADQRRAAGLIAQGRLMRDVADTLKVAPKTINRWSKIPAFSDLVRRQREALFPAGGVPTAEGALLDALSATRPDGTSDHQIRIQAARAILATPVTSKEAQEEAARVTEIYVAPPAGNGSGPEPEDDGAPRPWPIEGAAAR